MANLSFEIERYEIHLADSFDEEGSTIWARGAIACFGSAGQVLVMYFLAPGSRVPDPFYRPEGKVGAIFLPFSDIGPFVDLLRNEKPLYASLDSDKPHRNQIFSGREPVGEGEASPTALVARMAGLLG